MTRQQFAGARRLLGLSREHFGRAIGISRKQVERLESGEQHIRPVRANDVWALVRERRAELDRLLASRELCVRLPVQRAHEDPLSLPDELKAAIQDARRRGYPTPEIITLGDDEDVYLVPVTRALLRQHPKLKEHLS